METGLRVWADLGMDTVEIAVLAPFFGSYSICVTT
jgi:hypothetical protein